MPPRILHEVRLRQRLDAVLFAGTAIGGAALSVGLHLADTDPLIVAGSVAALIPLYALLARLTGRARFEPETAGDNCYYLGFLFTLVSLAWTLRSLGAAPEDTDVVRAVIAGFGVALASTIVGILFRVLMQQVRTDADLAERQARSDMVAAATRFRTELDQAAHVLADAIRGVSQKVEELAKATAEENRRAIAGLHVRTGEEFAVAAAALGEAADSLRVQAGAAAREMAAGHREAAAALQDSVEALQDSARATLATAEALRGAQADLARAVDGLARIAADGATRIDGIEAAARPRFWSLFGGRR